LFVGAAVCLCALAQQLLVSAKGDDLHFASPKLHFLTGKPLDHLRDGRSVAFDFHVRVTDEGKSAVLRAAFERFVISYDLWEERFSVTTLRTSRASASHLTAPAAEAWCLESLRVAMAGLPEDSPLWVRLDVRAQDPVRRRSGEEDEALSLGNLVDLFSRATRSQQPQQWTAEAGPIVLRNLRSGRNSN
jgi:hypothetical protein